MKKIISLVLALAMVLTLAVGTASAEEKKTAGFVTFGLGGDFFQMLADEFVAQFEALGWEASYADGQFNPAKQIEAAENYIAMGVDLLYIWAVAPEAMTGVVAAAQEQGIKVIAFVAPTESYDALMISDEAELADDLNRMAAMWIDEHFADAEDHSVPVAVFTCRAAETGVTQGNEMLKIEEYSKKAKFAIEIECQDETQATGQSQMENLYTTHPEIGVFITPHNDLAMGINAFFTAISSPVTDYTDMGIFCINGSSATADEIKASTEGSSPLRGTVLTGSVSDTASEMVYVGTGLMDGTLPTGHLQKAGTTFVYDQTIDEYLETGTVVSVTSADFR